MAPDAAPTPGGTPDGAGLTDVASRGPSGQAGVEPGSAGDGEATIAAYVALVRGRIEARKRYPGLARSRRAEGTVVALVHLEAGGGVRGVEILESPSGLLSEPTREAILAAGPFPPPPGELRRIRVPLRYALN